MRSPSIASENSNLAPRTSLSSKFNWSDLTIRCSENSNSRHEPSDPLKSHIERFCREQFSAPVPQTPSRSRSWKAGLKRKPILTFTVYELHTRSCSRAFEITVQTIDRPEPSKYILSVPLDLDLNPAATASHLRYIDTFCPSISVPRVINADSSRQNLLEEPYLLTTQLPGISGSSLPYHQLPHQAKCDIASQLGDIMRALFDRKVNTAGLLGESVVTNPEADLPASSFHIRPFPVRLANLRGDAETRSGKQCQYDSVLAWVEGQFARLRAAAEAKGSEEFAHMYEKLRIMAQELDKAELLGKQAGFGALHQGLCLSPDYLLLAEGKEGWVISGVLGWEEMVFAPCVRGTVYPDWLYEYDGAAAEVPNEGKTIDIRRAFEEAGGQEWVSLAHRDFDAAREICEIAEQGLKAWEIERGEDLVNWWADVKREVFDEGYSLKCEPDVQIGGTASVTSNRTCYENSVTGALKIIKTTGHPQDSVIKTFCQPQDSESADVTVWTLQEIMEEASLDKYQLSSL